MANVSVPVLLQQGFDPLVIGGGTQDTNNFRLTTDRGFSKYFDIYPFNNAQAALIDNCQATLNVGGQNLVQDTNLPFWTSSYHYGRDHKFRIRAEFSDGQTGTFTLNGTNPPASAVEQSGQIICYYSTSAHEIFKRNFKLRYGQGLKRREYYHIVPNVPGTDNISQTTFTAPRNNGNIIAVGVSTVVPLDDVAVWPNLEQHNTLTTILADGIEIIRDVSSTYYNAETSRDYFIQPISIQPGATFTIQSRTILGNTATFNIYLTLFFDN